MFISFGGLKQIVEIRLEDVRGVYCRRLFFFFFFFGGGGGEVGLGYDVLTIPETSGAGLRS